MAVSICPFSGLAESGARVVWVTAVGAGQLCLQTFPCKVVQPALLGMNGCVLMCASSQMCAFIGVSLRTASHTATLSVCCFPIWCVNVFVDLVVNVAVVSEWDRGSVYLSCMVEQDELYRMT